MDRKHGGQPTPPPSQPTPASTQELPSSVIETKELYDPPPVGSEIQEDNAADFAGIDFEFSPGKQHIPHPDPEGLLSFSASRNPVAMDWDLDGALGAVDATRNLRLAAV